MKNIKKYIGLSLLLSSAVMYGGDDDFVLLDVGDDGTISERPTDDQTGRQDNGSLNAARRSQGQQTGSDRQGNQGNGRQSTSTMPTIGRLIQRAKELVIAKQPTVTKNEPVNNPVTNQPTQPMTEDQHMEQFEALAKELDKPGTMGSLWSRFMNLFGKSNEVKTYQKFVTDDMKQQTAVITKSLSENSNKPKIMNSRG